MHSLSKHSKSMTVTANTLQASKTSLRIIFHVFSTSTSGGCIHVFSIFTTNCGVPIQSIVLQHSPTRNFKNSTDWVTQNKFSKRSLSADSANFRSCASTRGNCDHHRPSPGERNRGFSVFRAYQFAHPLSCQSVMPFYPTEPGQSH